MRNGQGLLKCCHRLEFFLGCLVLIRCYVCFGDPDILECSVVETSIFQENKGFVAYGFWIVIYMERLRETRTSDSRPSYSNSPASF